MVDSVYPGKRFIFLCPTCQDYFELTDKEDITIGPNLDPVRQQIFDQDIKDGLRSQAHCLKCTHKQWKDFEYTLQQESSTYWKQESKTEQ